MKEFTVRKIVPAYLCLLVLVLFSTFFFRAMAKNSSEESTPISDSESYYPKTAIVISVDPDSDTVQCKDAVGFIWEFYGVEDWMQGDVVSMIMDTNGTESIKDDIIIGEPRYSGALEDFQ